MPSGATHAVAAWRRSLVAGWIPRLAVLLCLPTALTAQGRQGGERQGGPPPVYRTDVPAYALNAVLARPTASSVTLSLHSSADRDVTLHLMPVGRRLTRHLTGGAPAEMEIDGLEPNREYSYRVEGGGASVDGRFRTARASGATFRFALQADSHLDGNSDPRMYVNTLKNIQADAPDFLIDLGDTFMTDKYRDFHDAAPQYAAQRFYFGLVGNETPVYFVAGNHDGEVGWRERGGSTAEWSANMRTKYFPAVRHNGFYSSAAERVNYYAWTWGDATFIVLDPFMATTVKPRDEDGWAWSLGKAQYDWLSATLRDTRSPYVFVFIHQLVGGTGRDARGGAEASVGYEWGGANRDGSAGFAAHRPGWAMPIHDLLVRHHVSAVFHGHDHLYVHQARDGMVYQEVPQPSFARDGATGSAAEYGYTTGTLEASSGHLRVTVSPTRATVEYVRSRMGESNQMIVDRYTLNPASRP